MICNKYFNAGDFNSPQNTMGSVGMQSYYSPSAASTIYKGNYGTVDSSAVGFGNNYEADKKTMGNGHLDFTEQNTAWGQGNSQGTAQQEVQGQVANATNQFNKPTEQRMGGGYFVDATVGEGSLLNRAGSGMIKWSESVGETAKMP
ncbi:TPA: hypothetical protein SHD65_001643 [Campylobacter coli]|nr:hypothetical protein [Campylobacter coli]